MGSLGQGLPPSSAPTAGSAASRDCGPAPPQPHRHAAPGPPRPPRPPHPARPTGHPAADRGPHPGRRPRTAVAHVHPAARRAVGMGPPGRHPAVRGDGTVEPRSAPRRPDTRTGPVPRPSPGSWMAPSPSASLPALSARPVGPARGPARGVIAVTSSRGQGGLGCTTTALTLAGALARTGATVAFLGADDPNGLHRILKTTPQSGQWHDLLPDLPDPGTLRAMALPERTRRLGTPRQCSPQARHRGSRRRHGLPATASGRADAAVVLTDLDPTVWGSTEVLDRRPDWAQVWDWLNTRYLTARARDALPAPPIPGRDVRDVRLGSSLGRQPRRLRRRRP